MPPEGCALQTQAATELHLLVKGLVDTEKELAKLEKKKTKLAEDLERYIAETEKPGFEKAPEKVQESLNEKIRRCKTEQANVERAIDMYKKMSA